ncbi:hypothetical protein SNE40_014124 [Patella caerulea]|uniref:Uncharacterized protein n=1 Tax=Patella caerulea TaxID=87958 RepID=A0AAN8JHK4_PATCE
MADEENDGVSHTQRSQNKGRDLHNVEYQNSKHAIKHKPTECSDSESETDSSDWATDDEDRYKEKNFIILDATNNTTTDTTNRNQNKKKRNDRHKEKPHSSRKHFSPRKGKYINVDGNDMDDYNQASGHSGTKLSDRKNRRNTTAIIEVQQTVELDIQDGGLVEEGQENREQKKLAVPVSSKSNMLPVGEGEFIMGDGDGILPAPSIMVESRGKKGIQVMWELPESPDPKYKLLLYVVNVVGVKFSKEINSDIR